MLDVFQDFLRTVSAGGSGKPPTVVSVPMLELLV